MKFEKINGEQFVILENNDQVCLTTDGHLGKNSLKITKEKDKINLDGDSSLIKNIYGEGMLEKIYIPPIFSSEEIICQCDNWLEMFKQIHDVFKKLVLSEKYKKQRVSMELSFLEFFSLKDPNIKGHSIQLDLMQYETIIQEGVTISIDEKNENIYAYLMANVLSYYLSKNYNGTEIDYLSFNWNGTLYSNIETPIGETRPIISRLSPLYNSINYARIVKSLLRNHNLGIPADQIISNLKSQISNQQLSKRINTSIDYSTKQYEFIMTNLGNEKQSVLNRTLAQEE